MNLSLSTILRPNARRAVLAGSLLMLWLGILLVAIVPDLHRRVHCDQASATSPCVFVRLAHGTLLQSAPVAIEVPPPPAIAWYKMPPQRETKISAFCGHWLPFSCGPPTRLSLPLL